MRLLVCCSHANPRPLTKNPCSTRRESCLWTKWTQAICFAKYTEPSIAEGLGVVGSCSARLQQVRGSNPGGGGSQFGWIWAAWKTNSEKFRSVLGVRVNQFQIGENCEACIYQCTKRIPAVAAFHKQVYKSSSRVHST